MKKGCLLIIHGTLVVIVVIIVLGQVIATSIINVQKSACGLVQESASQIGNSSPSQIDEKCLDLVVSAIPLTRGIAVVASLIVSIFVCALLFSILGVATQFT